MDISDLLDAAMKTYRGGQLKQAELSRMSGVPQPTISRTLKGKSVPETETLYKLAAALEIPFHQLTRHGDSPSTISSMPSKHAMELRKLMKLAEAISESGIAELIGAAKILAKTHPRAVKGKRAK